MADTVEPAAPRAAGPLAPPGPPPAPTVIPPRAGESSFGWRIVIALTWIGVALGVAAVWNASVQLGLATWWLGPRADPQPRFVQFLPFVAPVVMVLAAVNRVRRLPVWGLIASVAVAAVAIGDLGRVTSLALVELAIAACAAMVSVASFTGVYRIAGDARAHEPPVDV